MKTKIKLFCSAIIIAIIFFACYNNDTEEYKLDNPEVNQISLTKVSSLYKKLNMSETHTVFLGNKLGILQHTSVNKEYLNNFPDLEVKKYSMILAKEKNLNFILEKDESNNQIISINFYTENNSIKGLAVYYLSNTNMFVDIFDVKNNRLVRVDKPAKIVNDVVFQDVNYIGSKYFSGKNILSYITKYNKPKLENNYNDLVLERTLSIFNVNQMARKTAKKDNSLITQKSSCSMAVHHCQSGSGTRCTANGCTDSCTKIILNSMTANISEESNGEESTDLSKSLPENNLYKFEDKLNTTPIGTEYVNFYYSIGEHFIDAMDTEILWDVFKISHRVNIAVEKFNNNEDSIVIDAELYSDIKSIMERAKNNSKSEIFHSAADKFLDELNSYEGKTAIEINKILNEYK